MNIRSLKKGCCIALAVYIVLALAFYWIGGDQLHYRDVETDMLSAGAPIGEITKDTVITQQIEVEGGQLTGLTLIGATYARQNTGTLKVEVLDGEDVLDEKKIDVSTINDNQEIEISYSPEIYIPTSIATIRITSEDGREGNAITLYCGNAISTARAQVAMQLKDDECAYLNGKRLDVALCVQVHSREKIWFGDYYWWFALVGFIAVVAFCIHLIHAFRVGKRTLTLNTCAALTKYSYLMKQLVSRDFKTKYKRSVLGVLWSFLNPLLTMGVQYMVFSTLFKSDIPNFMVYLLSGVVCFSFFSEATSMALGSIVGNASLITKVYVPKYIYPVTRVMSSGINFGLSLIPLFFVLLVTRTPIRPSILLLPYGVGCLFAFSLGVGMFLAASMVFFRDTQFLWGVVNMLWMYATPVFYPESIIPAKIMPFYKCNPLYHIIRFIRIVLMDGVSPEPKAYLLTFIVAFVPFLIGATVFKRTQDKFVLNI